MARRNLTGAPGTDEVRTQLARWQKVLGAADVLPLPKRGGRGALPLN
jgi:hypothetical protein